ncbi:TPA: thioredoxin domain-containing protein [Klebsiella pneumoniae]|uniref:thioredoxin family protein n=1 Tax=Enterobacteriaceae TaxID=543 RepID=UPI002073E2EE|nr:thioredoxin domain-containing protein [Enterobacter bugandensis]HBQ1079196.1 thioredoxin [Klebsiella pneumoniae]HBU9459769.1 thioredoxin [Klebsiella pneumoniae]HBV7394885.1 thioredoxin [Klebsiella pneumoniae]HBV7575957.1 thioredoxin [Klebsiella pneumoniae]
MSELKKYDENNFCEIERYSGVSVVRLYADWCAPCRESDVVFREFARQLPEDIRTGVVNVILAPTLTWKYDIASIPVTLFFRQGQLVKRAYGPKSISELSRDLMCAKDQQAYH